MIWGIVVSIIVVLLIGLYAYKVASTPIEEIKAEDNITDDDYLAMIINFYQDNKDI